jgi:cytidylate kinase
MLITIDGPAGAGKTTVSRMLAGRLGYRYIDTGALYRGIALAVSRSGVDPDDDDGLRALCRGIRLDFALTGDGDELRLELESEDITQKIRAPHITMLASAVSARPPVREYLLALQRELGSKRRAVFEGRDMGTVVFPEADLKFFLEADLEIRARRRFEELPGDAGQSLADVEADMRKRDNDDSTRQIAPLKPAADAIRIDVSHRSALEVVDLMLDYIQKAA